MRQMVEKDVIGHHAGHGDDAPACLPFHDIAQPLEIGDFIGGDRQLRKAVHIGLRGATGDQPYLALEQRLPGRVRLGRVGRPVLVDRPVRTFRHITADNPVFFINDRCTVSHGGPPYPAR